MVPIFLNPMSRNGTSLIFQLLAGHSDFFLYPARIHFACSKPRGWPLYGFKEMPFSHFFEKFTDKHFIDVGNDWQTMKHICIRDPDGLDMTELAKGLESHQDCNVSVNSLRDFFVSYCEGIISQINVRAVKAYQRSRFLVFQEDHMYVLGEDTVSKIFPDALFLQVIRNLYDVLASRKNLLLYHNGFSGDPREKTLKKEVIEAEATRWTWSVISAALSKRSAGHRYVTLRFENLRQTREETMRHFSKQIGIDFHPILLEETVSGDEIFTMNGNIRVGSSLKQVTGGRKSQRVNAYQATFNDEERDVVEEFEKQFSYRIPDQTVPSEFEDRIDEFYECNLEAVESNSQLACWNTLFAKRELAELFESYSSLNYGGAQAQTAFEA